MIKGPILGIANVTKPFEVETDASDFAIGCPTARGTPHCKRDSEAKRGRKKVRIIRERNAGSGPLLTILETVPPRSQVCSQD